MRSARAKLGLLGLRSVVGVGVLMLASSSFTACGDCNDEAAAAQDFVDDPANQACETDADCEVVTTGCDTLEGGTCGQVALSRTAAASSKWRLLNEQLHDCAPSHCDQCEAQLGALCTDGLCEGI